MGYEFIEVARRERITTITLNRPEVMNAINPPMHQELQSALDDFAADPEQFICVLTGAGDRAFSAGSDLKAPRAEGYPKCGYAGISERFDLNKPVVAAVNGVALGGGFEIALACDIVLASENASFGLPEPLVGAMALAGGVHRLVRQIGMKQAMGMMLASRRVGAEEGLRLGFVNEVVAQGGLKAATARWCDAILKGAPMAVRATKEVAVRGVAEPSLAAAIKNQASYPAYAAWWASELCRKLFAMSAK